MTAKRSLTPDEERAADHLRALFSKSEMTEEALGEAVDRSPGAVWQWLNKRIPVSASIAPALAEALGEPDPGRISPAWRAIAQNRAQLSSAPVAGETPTRRLEKDIDELREWTAALLDYLVRYAPGAGVHIERMMTAKPPQYLSRGMRKLLLNVIAEARPAAVAAPSSARRRAKR